MWGGLAVVAVALVAACGTQSTSVQPGYNTQQPAPSGSGGAGGVQHYLQSNPAAKTVTLQLVAAATDAQGGFNFNGYSNGALKVTVPTGWTVTVQCSNQGAVPHSCAIVHGAADTKPAFPNAASPNPTVGLEKGQQASFTFQASQAGNYRIVCLVPGHEQSGMWDTFVVSASGQPSISASSG
jgi:sulfocyanin